MAVVTGASSGIGAAIVKELCRNEIIVVGLARRLDRLLELKKEISMEDPNLVFHPIKCDLTLESDIKTAFEYVAKTLGGVDILLNNAGKISCMTTLDSEMDDLKKVIDLNLLAVISCTKKAYKSMSERYVPGYIITISSVSGYYVDQITESDPPSNVYSPTKFGLRALHTVLRHELNFLKKSKIRISNISPGNVRTEMSDESALKEIPHLEADDVADVVLYMLSTDPRVQIEDVIIRPTGEV